MNEEKINELVYNITNIINEELGIANAIVRESNKLEKFIISDLKNASKYSNGVISYKKNDIPYRLFDTDVNIHYHVYTIGYNAIKNKLVGEIEYTFEKIDLHLNLAMLNGQPIDAFFGDTIYHELTHLYQYIKSKKETLMNKKENSLYQILKTIKNKNEDNDICVFANALYISFDFERDAMVHGLYARTMKERFGRSVELIIRCSFENEYLYDVKWAIDNIDLFPEDIFKMSKKSALLRFKNTYNRYSRKIGKVLIKAQDDLDSEKYRFGELTCRFVK